MKHKIEGGNITITLELNEIEVESLQRFFTIALELMEDHYTLGGIEDEAFYLQAVFDQAVK